MLTSSAALEITNSASDDLTSINITIDIRNQYGNPANHLFSLLPPQLSGITGDGTDYINLVDV